LGRQALRVAELTACLPDDRGRAAGATTRRMDGLSRCEPR
jgi:hypothetical protein